jgi:hypothetical protein
MSDEGEYDEDFEQGSPETSPGRGGRRAVAYWATLAEGVPPGPHKDARGVVAAGHRRQLVRVGGVLDAPSRELAALLLERRAQRGYSEGSLPGWPQRAPSWQSSPNAA